MTQEPTYQIYITKEGATITLTATQVDELINSGTTKLNNGKTVLCSEGMKRELIWAKEQKAKFREQ